MGFFIIIGIICAAGALSIKLLAVASLQKFQRDRWERDLRNPVKWFLWGLVSPITLTMAFFDWAFTMEHTGYVDGREAVEEVTRRKAEQIEAQAMINGYRNVD